MNNFLNNIEIIFIFQLNFIIIFLYKLYDIKHFLSYFNNFYYF